MKRLISTLATAGLLASALGLGVLTRPAFAAGSLSVTIDSAGTKKVDVRWADGTAVASAAFDSYLVTLDNDSDATPATADRSRFVVAAGTREVRFEDLNSNTTYYASVYAVDFHDTGFTVVPPTGGDPDTALGASPGDYTPLTIKASKMTALSGRTVTLSGTLKDGLGKPLTFTSLTLLYDVYPQFGGIQTKTATTDANGRWSLTSPALTANTWFWAEYGAPGLVGGWTARILVEVRKKISVSVSPGLKVQAGTAVKFSGNVNGNPDFLDDASVKVCLQRLQSGKWGKLFCRAIEPNGDYLLTFKPGPNADGKYRVFSGMGPAYADSWSRVKTLTVT